MKVYRRTNGFLHHKLTLLDTAIAAVSTANFDNRAFLLNFEIIMEVRDADFADTTRDPISTHTSF